MSGREHGAGLRRSLGGASRRHYLFRLDLVPQLSLKLYQAPETLVSLLEAALLRTLPGPHMRRVLMPHLRPIISRFEVVLDCRRLLGVIAKVENVEAT